MFKLSYSPYTLQNKYVFRIAGNARSSTPLMLVRISFDNICGYGEASMPPRYGESHQTAAEFLSKVDLSRFKDPFDLESILGYVDSISPGNPAVKAAIDIALHDLIGKMTGLPVRSYFGLSAVPMKTCKTIGIDTPDMIAKKVQEAAEFPFLKIKLGDDNDEEIIRVVRENSDQPLYIDANQGWKTGEIALEKIEWLKEENVEFIEQPLPAEQLDDLSWLVARSPLPIVGDEGIQRFSDVRTASEFYHGINIKLMKSTGLREAYKMAQTAKMMGLKVMFGCMAETSCAIGALAQLGQLADWLDLDGNLGVTNDPFSAHTVKNGTVYLNELPGIGLKEPDWDQITKI
ncbi:dipeptide epimerase [Robertkochia solimangrovi]|uniref:dipeptide epimerase n=1 Tax=Robertkochia solimangrovi TaxID=2213046 RepID=UPI00117F78F0|nr:dipeptide epimerase [Robertkochia solimangrovi]TRZ41285.1 dipeptide epimerase [Robertkochia solimangrovi]